MASVQASNGTQIEIPDKHLYDARSILKYNALKDGSQAREMFQSDSPSHMDTANYHRFFGALREQRFPQLNVLYAPCCSQDMGTIAEFDAKVNYSTGFDNWGKLEEFSKEYDVAQTLGNSIRGNYDQGDPHVLDCNGPQGIQRAVVIQQALGREVTKIQLFSFDIQPDGKLLTSHPSTPNVEDGSRKILFSDNEPLVKRSMGYIIDTKDQSGKEDSKLFLYHRVRLPGSDRTLRLNIEGAAEETAREHAKIVGVKKFLSQLSEDNATGMLIKEFPDSLIPRPGEQRAKIFQDFFSFPENKLTGVLRGERQQELGRRSGSCAIGIDIASCPNHESLDLQAQRVQLGSGYHVYIDTKDPHPPLRFDHIPRYDDLSEFGQMIHDKVRDSQFRNHPDYKRAVADDKISMQNGIIVYPERSSRSSSPNTGQSAKGVTR